MNRESVMLAEEVHKLEELLAANELTPELTLYSYPITLTITKDTPEQISLYDGDERHDSEAATAKWSFFDDELFFRIDGGRFTIARELRNKIERSLLRIISLNLQNVFSVYAGRREG